MPTYEARTVSVSVDRPWREVYDFASQPLNFPRWASGLGANLERSGETWTAQGPDGAIRIRFSPPNEFGILDHTVITATGAEIPNPMRVMANGTGSEIAFTVFRTPGVSAQKFAGDVDWVSRDLQALKALLEAKA